MYKKMLAAALIPLAAAGCSDATGANEQGQLAIRFAAASTGASASFASGALFSRAAQAGTDELVLADGTVITDIRLIVSEFKLKRTEGACAAGQEDDACEKFESLPYLLDLPLGSGAVNAATALVPDGTYTELEFEVEDLDLDDEDDSDDEDSDDAAKRAAIAQIATTLRGLYPSFPENASIVVRGRSAQGVEFTVYFDAEIEVEIEFAAPVTVPGTDALTVNVNPATWLDGLDLPSLNGKTVEFELETKFKSGFEDIEQEDDEEKDSDD